MFYALAISLVSQEAIMPLLVSELTDSTIAVGLIPAIFSLSFLLPQLFVANHAERLPRKLPFVLLGSGLLQRLPYPLIGVALLLFALEAPGLALLLFFIGIATAAFGGGIVTPAWFSMIGVVVPTRRRGIFFGLADGGGLLMGVIGAYFVGRVLDSVDYPGSFALLFLVAGCDPRAILVLALADPRTTEPCGQGAGSAAPLFSALAVCSARSCQLSPLPHRLRAAAPEYDGSQFLHRLRQYELRSEWRRYRAAERRFHRHAGGHALALRLAGRSLGA